MKSLVLMMAVLGLSGCATVTLTEAGKNVKIVEKDFVNEKDCKKISTILHQNEMKFGGAAVKIVVGDIKNKVGTQGGNVATTSFDLNGTWNAQTASRIIPIGSRIPINIYKCSQSFWNTLVSI